MTGNFAPDLNIGDSLSQHTPRENSHSSGIGNNDPVKLLDFIKEIEINLNKKAILNFMPIQPGDVPKTFADVTDLIKDLNYEPQISIKFGVKQFVDWYNDFYKI